VYLYQGEELGLPEVLDLPDSARQDPIFVRTNGAQIGRDGCRVPMPWTSEPVAAHGFSPAGAAASPWLPQPDGWGRYAAERQAGDPRSMLSLYRRLLAARRELLGAADAELLEEHDDLVVLRRGDVVVACNAGRTPVECQAAAGLRAVVTTGDDAAGTTVPADSTVWFAP
jgi:alpha-glucosidase